MNSVSKKFLTSHPLSYGWMVYTNLLTCCLPPCMPGENLEMEDPGQRLWGEGRPPCLRERGVKTIEPNMGYGFSPGPSGLWQNIRQTGSGLEELLLLRSGLTESLWAESGLVELRLLLAPFFHRADRRMILMLWSEVSGTQYELNQTCMKI